MSELLNDTSFIDLPLFVRGKVRNVYDLGDSLLIVVTDRISAFDVVFDELIPDKGKVLNSIAAFWFDYTKDVVPNHVISTNPAEYPLGLDQYADQLAGRSMWVKKVQMLPWLSRRLCPQGVSPAWHRQWCQDAGRPAPV